MESPCLVEDLDTLLTDCATMGVPINSLIETALMGIVNNDVGYRYMLWLDRQLTNPEAVTIMYFQYNGEKPSDVYNQVFLLLLVFLKRVTRTLVVNNLICTNVRLLELNETTMVVSYEFRNANSYDPQIHRRSLF